ncbi:MAG: Crp/Fnr family transcriptional regulator [Corynebacterium casei]|uniref:Crp/Fnr family transcriptional regulator n=1 Tax=Corynebacterium casei TaxID=160386 RepID=UPI003F8F640F
MTAASLAPTSALTDSLSPVVFRGFDEEEISRVSRCLGVQSRQLQAGDSLAHAGEQRGGIGVVVEGTVLARNIDADGDTLLLDVISRGEVFCADILWTDGNRTNYTVSALSDCRVLLIGMSKILRPEGALCELRTRVVENLFSVMLEKNRKMEEHLRLVSLKSLRSRLLHFLLTRAQDSGASTFMIHLSRQEMADHLHADRAAVSRELSRMKSDGLIDYYRNSFQLLRMKSIESRVV